MPRSPVPLVPVLLSIPLMTACGTIPSTATVTPTDEAVRVACSAFAPITYSADGDTAETVTQIRAHNAAGAALGCW